MNKFETSKQSGQHSRIEGELGTANMHFLHSVNFLQSEHTHTRHAKNLSEATDVLSQDANEYFANIVKSSAYRYQGQQRAAK